MRDLELGMLIVGGVSLGAAVCVVAATARHLARAGERDARVAVMLAASQAGLLTPLWLSSWSYVYSWAELAKPVYVLSGVIAFVASGALLLKLPRNAASRRQP